jgi:hypothetical protein
MQIKLNQMFILENHPQCMFYRVDFQTDNKARVFLVRLLAGIYKKGSNLITEKEENEA